MNSEKMARHAEAFGEAHSKSMTFKDSYYDETQCRECPYDHACCEMIVACGPFEALGIIHYMRQAFGGEGTRARLSLIRVRAKQMQDHIKSHQDKDGNMDEEAHTRMADGWFAKGIKCVFYNSRDKRCSIYPVRPIACRRTFGTKDCREEGVSTAHPHEFAEVRRLTRIKITQGPPIEQHRELTSLIDYLSGAVPLGMSKGEQELLEMEPMLLSDDDHLWGPDGPPKQLNAVHEGV